MLNFFLKAKHWQLFLVMFVFPMLVYFIFVISLVTNIVINDDPSAMIGMMYWLPVIMLSFMFGTFSWLWAVGLRLYHKLPSSVNMNLGRFKFFLGTATIYLILMPFFTIFLMISVIESMSPQIGPAPMPDFSSFAWFILIIPLHFFSIFCIMYAFYFNAKAYKSIELNREAQVGEYIGQFFLFWFHFVGIWIMQPQINKYHSGTFKPNALNQPQNQPEQSHQNTIDDQEEDLLG